MAADAGPVRGSAGGALAAAEIFAHHTPVSDEDYLDFQMDLEGMTRTASYYDRSNLILGDGDPEFWADTIVWFLGLLPADADLAWSPGA
ncbi:hypothetical protein ACWEKM_07620 [Streptomyces sp. NPDC004752]